VAAKHKKPGPVASVKLTRPYALEADVSEAFRRARSSIGHITTDLKRLQRQTTSAVKTAKRPAKQK
jgi:hypothetical protein